MLSSSQRTVTPLTQVFVGSSRSRKWQVKLKKLLVSNFSFRKWYRIRLMTTSELSENLCVVLVHNLLFCVIDAEIKTVKCRYSLFLPFETCMKIRLCVLDVTLADSVL